MSWQKVFEASPKFAMRITLEKAELYDYHNEPRHAAYTIEETAARDQFEVAKRVAMILLDTVPGPWVYVNLYGHANGVGYYDKPGMATDGITVSVTQMIPPPEPNEDRPTEKPK